MIEPSVGVRVRERLEQLLEMYEASRGEGPDPFCEDSTYHAMAEAKYLLALAHLRRAEVLSAPGLGKRSQRAIERLDKGAVLLSSTEQAWGLRFAHGAAAKDEPYVVTTGLVVSALDEMHVLTSGQEPRSMAGRGVAWLLAFAREHSIKDRDAVLPWYSPSNPRVISNAVAVHAAALDTDARSRADSVAAVRWLERNYTVGFGWPYEPGQSRYDLVHEGYILNSVARVIGFQAVEAQALEVLSRFMNARHLTNKIDVISVPDTISRAAASLGVTPRFLGEHAWLAHEEHAPPWSTGEFLLCAGTGMAHGRYPAYWKSLAIRYSRFALASDPEEDLTTYGVRQMMHLAHGLAAVLAALRRA